MKKRGGFHVVCLAQGGGWRVRCALPWCIFPNNVSFAPLTLASLLNGNFGIAFKHEERGNGLPVLCMTSLACT